jgi:hypothetical protein
MHLGDYYTGAVINHKFTTVNSSGIPSALTAPEGTGEPTIFCYKGSGINGTDTGLSVTTDFDSIAGLNSININTSNAFYATNHNFNLVVVSGLVDGRSVNGYNIGSFSLEKASLSGLEVSVSNVTLDDNQSVNISGWNGGPVGSLPVNFSDLAITASNGRVTVGTNNDKTGYTVSTVSDKTGYSLANNQSVNISGWKGEVPVDYPSNFADLSVTSGTGRVTVGTNNDKAGYSLSADQSSVTIGTVNNLGTNAEMQVNSGVLDVLTVDTFDEPSSVPAATTNIQEMIHWMFTLSRNKLTQTSSTFTVRNDADSGNISTAGVADDGTTFTRNEYV